ncbi:MAG: hypothetical protein M3014_10285 [Chloroflexota bacterium]|nr:hypothetical protein [Chloroflexota bacterium]
MKQTYRVALVVTLIAGLFLALAPRQASAHPMGNFSINQYAAITVNRSSVDVRYVLDMAEIPTVQELQAIHGDSSADITQAQQASYMAAKSAELARNLTLTIGGKPATLLVKKTALSFPPGAGGLPTMRVEMNLTADAGGLTSGSVEFNNANFPGRVGWHDVIANAGSGVALQGSSVPTIDVTAGLTKYTPDATSNPPQITSATFRFAPGTSSAAQAGGSGHVTSPIQGALNWAMQRQDALTDLIGQKNMPLDVLLIGLLIAFGMGAAHALSPGHGKTVVAAYLVGSRGTAIHATYLGFIVTISHTIGVFLLGFVVLNLQKYVLPETLYPWMSFLSGLLIMIVGLTLFVQRYRASRRLSVAAGNFEHSTDHQSHDYSEQHHGHSHDGSEYHSHEHEHGHDHAHTHSHDAALVPHKHGPFGRPHTHLPADGQKITAGNLLALGISGGIIPCPSALVVLLVAVASHRVELGLALIVAFSFGLAAVLTGIGILMVYSRGLVSRLKFNGFIFSKLPMASALAVSCLGFLLAFQAFGFK